MSIEVNHDIWRAVVGPSVEIPAVNSYVCYFPQGHLESSSVHGDYNYQGFPSIPCRVLSLRFLCNSSSDEYFVKISLLPLQAAELWYIQKYMNENNEENDNNNDQTDIASFLKVLTPSDANIHGKGGFSVPKYYANEILPKLNLSDDPHPAQSLSIRDAHNNAWEFRHIYRGVPPRHLLTTGWSKFVDIKRLVARDSVVFMKKKSTEELFIGIRRDHVRLGADEINNRIHAALDAVQRAMTGLVFEVDYYPRLGFPEFVVSGARVDRSLRIQWHEEMRVKMAVPATDDPGRITCFEGKIESVNIRNNSGQWPQSPWRMLQISWDEPGVHPNLKKVSPWGVVEYCERPSLSSQLSSAFPPCKKLKLSQNPAEILPDDEGDHDGEFSFPNLIETHLNSAPSFQYPPFPSTLGCDDSNHQSFTELLKSGMEKEHETVSTVLSIGRSICEPSSTNVEQGQNSSRGDGGRSFVLLGKIIQPAENPTEVGGSRDNGGFSDGDRYVSENVQPNSSLGFNNNNKGKNVLYE